MNLMIRKFLDNKNFMKLWVSQILSQVTINMMNFSLLVYLFSKTGSSIAVSFLWISYAIPALFVGPFGATLADFGNRRKILMVTNISQSIIILTYSLIYGNYFFLTYVVVMLYSFFNQFYVPAEAAMLPTLVKRKSLPEANSLFFVTQQAAIILGFGIASTLHELVGIRLTFWIASALIFLAFISVNGLPKLKILYPKRKRNFEESASDFFGRILEGYKFIKNNKEVLTPFLFLMSIQIGISILVIIVPALSRDILSIKASSSGILVIAPAGLGAVIGSFILRKLLNSGWRKKKTIETSLTLIAVDLINLVLIVPILSYGPKFVLTEIGFVLAGIAAVGVIIPTQTYLQEVTPGGMRGRVFGNFWFLTTAATIIPVLFSATLTEILGVRFLLIFLALSALFASFLSRKFGQNYIEKSFV